MKDGNSTAASFGMNPFAAKVQTPSAPSIGGLSGFGGGLLSNPGLFGPSSGGEKRDSKATAGP